MKICFVAPRFHTNQHALVETLADRGHEVTFYVTDFPDSYHSKHNHKPFVIDTRELPKFAQSVIAHIMSFSGRRLRKPLYTVPKIRSLYTTLKQQRPDVIIVRDLLTPLSLITFLTANTLHIRTILYQQKALEKRPHFLVRLAQIFGIAPRTLITPIRKTDATSVRHGKTIVYYCPLGTSTQNVPSVKKSYFKNNLVNIINIGKFTLRRKNHIALLRALSELKHHDFHLTLIGTAPKKDNPLLLEIKNSVKEYGLADRVTIIKNIHVADTGKYYMANDLFVLPSYKEPYAVTPLEAMSYGLPVILTEDNGTKYDVTNGHSGYIVPVNGDSLKDVLDNLLKNREKIALMGKNAAAHFNKNHSRAAIYNCFIEAVK